MDTLTLISPKQANENFKNGITQAKIMKKHNGGDCSESKLSSFTLAHSFAGVLYSTLILFKDYLRHLGMVAMAAVVAILACSLKGDLVFLALLTYKTYSSSSGRDLFACVNNDSTSYCTTSSANETIAQGQTNVVTKGHYVPILPEYLQLPEDYNLKDLLFYQLIAVGSSVIMYHFMCGLLQIYFYTWRRNDPEKWKCQPHRFLTRSNEIHEIVVGTINMCLASMVSGFLACWVVNGNYSTVYFRIDEYGYVYFVLSIVLVFLYLDAGAYYSHYLLHTPLLYKTVHKHHHRYHSPTAYSFIAMSPFELMFYDSIFIAPIFLFRVHAAVYIGNLVYVYYFGLVDHSGIKMTSVFPWQPDSMFHDDHHKYFHVNFGFNTYLFDWLHGTQRRKDRVYGEDIFGGKGQVDRKKMMK